jgi:2,5-diketo-D-gluconate reductase A
MARRNVGCTAKETVWMTIDQPTVTLPGGGAMPLLGFGTWQLHGRTAYQATRAALELGYRHIDTATLYRNEREVGQALLDAGIPRTEVFVTSKLRPQDAGREGEVIEASLDALGIDQLDLWLIHWPPRSIVRTWRALLDIRAAGLTRDVGVSNFSVAQLDEVAGATGEMPAVNQIRWGPRLYDGKLLAAHRERGVVLEGYSPLATTDLKHPVLAGIAARHGATPAQVVIRWHIDHEIVVIPKSARRERIAENAGVWDLHLTPDELRAIDALSRT